MKVNKSERPTEKEFEKHKQDGTRRRENPLRDVILGGQDGLVNALGIVLGIWAAGGNVNILIATVLAASAAESISMGAVAYTSSLSQRDHYEAEKVKVKIEIDEKPEMGREEVRQIFEKKGFSGGVLGEIVERITSDRDLWLRTILGEELHVHSVETHAILKSSIIVGVATAIGSLIPVLPFFLVGSGLTFIIAVVLSVSLCAVSLFGVGAYQAITLVGTWWKSGLRLVIIGLSAAIIGYFIARIFNASGV